MLKVYIDASTKGNPGPSGFFHSLTSHRFSNDIILP